MSLERRYPSLTPAFTLMRARWFLTAAWLGAFTVTHLPPSELEVPSWPYVDKVAHFTIYFCLSVLLCLQTRSDASRRTLGLRIILVLAIYGALDELTQPWMGRGAELADWFADLAGATAAVFLWSRLEREHH